MAFETADRPGTKLNRRDFLNMGVGAGAVTFMGALMFDAYTNVDKVSFVISSARQLQDTFRTRKEDINTMLATINTRMVPTRAGNLLDSTNDELRRYIKKLDKAIDSLTTLQQKLVASNYQRNPAVLVQAVQTEKLVDAAAKAVVQFEKSVHTKDSALRKVLFYRRGGTTA